MQTSSLAEPVQKSDTQEDPFGFSLDHLRFEAVERVSNARIRDSILRVKHGKVDHGFVQGYDKAYHSHSST